VKVFRLDLAPERVHRLVDDLGRVIGANLVHPAIVVARAAGIAGVSAYLVQDFVDAESLDIKVRDRGPAQPVDALRAAAGLAAALDVAAEAGVLHGALHPRDVYLAPGAARLTGLGVTRALERAGAPVPVRRPYTAPERAAGRPWDHRADIFSLAVLIHELLWGRRPMAMGDQVAAMLTDVEGANPVLLGRTFARAMAEEPADRFDSALAFVAALQHALSGAASRSQASLDFPRRPQGIIEAARRADVPLVPRFADGALHGLELRGAQTPQCLDVTAPLHALSPSSRTLSPFTILVAAVMISPAVFGAGFWYGNRGVLPTALSETSPTSTAAVTVATSSDAPPTREAPIASAASLQVESRPTGARVIVDNRVVGTTPLVLDQVAPGAHVVGLELDGYGRWTASVRLVAGERGRVAASLGR